MVSRKIDGVGPVNKKPSTNYLHHFVQEKKRKKWDMWHVTRDSWQVGGGEPSLLIQLLRFFENIFTKDHQMNELMNEWITTVFVEQPWLHRVC